jgi:hypothetical protein
MDIRRCSAIPTALLRAGPALALALALAPSTGAAQAGTSRDDLDDYLGRLVTEVRAFVPDLEIYEPFLVLAVVHDERGYRVRASDLLERRLADALAAQRVRVIDQAARQSILDQLEACYTEEAPFCRASDVVGRFQTAGGIFEGSVLPVRGGVELRLKLVIAVGAGELSAGEILGTWSVVIPPPALDPATDLLPAAGVISYGRPGADGDSLGAQAYGELRIDVRTQDGTQAWVRIDGRVNVPAPVTTTTTAERHLLIVTASGHRPFSDYVNVPPRGMVRREIYLERGAGSIWVRSNAVDAVVFLDGERVGTTPWRGRKLETGPYSIRVEREGYQPFAREILLEHEEEEQVYAELEEMPGDIVITCLQDDISIFLDRASSGPVGRCSTGESLILTDVPAGLHRIWGARGPDRTDTMTITVKGGAAVPLSLGLRLDLPEDYRKAEIRRASEEFEPFGGYRWHSGIYVGLGFILGQADWNMSLSDTAGSFKIQGQGLRLAFDLFFDPWELDLGVDIIYLDDFGSFDGSNRYTEEFIGLTYYFFPQSSIRPFVGLRGTYNTISLEAGQDRNLSSADFGYGVSGGAAIRLGRIGILELGATYSRASNREFVDDMVLSGWELQLGSLSDWQFISGYIEASVDIWPSR